MRRRLAAILLLSLVACEPRPAPTAPPPADAPPFAPRWEAAAAAQAVRRGNLTPLYASGQVELRWTDEEGRHFEYCRGELFLRLPSESALSLTKVGERLLWLGSDGESRWLFDLRSKAPVLWLEVPGGEGSREGEMGAARLAIRRTSMVDLLGLMELPPAEALDAILDPEPARGGPETAPLIAEFAGAAGPVRVHVDPATGLPLRVAVLDDEGTVLLESALEEYGPADRPGLPPGALPRFPRRVVVATPDGEQELRLFLEPASGGEARVADRLFDLEALLRTFKPARIERW